MPAPRSRFRWTTLALALLTAAACADGDEPAPLDSALARDLTLAAGDTGIPELADVPTEPPPTRATAPTPSRPQTQPRRVQTPPPQPRPEPNPPPVVAPPPSPTPAPTPAPAPAPRRVFAAGTTMGFTIGSRACTTNLPGDKFVATLTEAVIGSDGAVLPVGTRAVIEVASVTQGSNNTPAQITFRIRSMSTQDGTLAPVGEALPVDSLEQVRADSKGSDAKKVAGGAIAGAIIGQILGKDTKGTVIGAAAGAAAGTAVAVATSKYEGCLPAGGRIRFALAEPLEIK